MFVWQDKPSISTPLNAVNLAAAFADKLDAEVASATYAPTLGARPHYLDAWTGFFLNAGAWVTGQGAASTTLTAAASAGATALAVASGAGFINGASIITNPGSSTQQIYQVTAGGGTASLTVTPAVVTTLVNGATILPLWTNSTHLTNPEGMSSWGYWLVNAKTSGGALILTDPGPTRPVVILGDSWASQLGTTFATHVHALYPSATVVNVGIAGNTSTQMIARFATNVPSNAAFVYINEPGVNDVAQGFTQAQIAANLETLVALIRGIGAVPIITGMVPLADWPGLSAQRETELAAQVGDGTVFPAQSASSIAAHLPMISLPNTTSMGVGPTALDGLVTGLGNTAVGSQALTAITTGAYNTGIGQNAARALVTGSLNTAVGQAALSASTASSGTAVGQNALVLASTGTGNTALGASAGYAPNGVTAGATTTASYQTAVGYQAGCSASGSYATALGANTTAAGYGSTAVGAGASATALGSVALGRDSAGTGASSAVQDQISLGTALHTTKILGRLVTAVGTTAKAGVNIPHGAAPTAPVDGDVWSTTAGLFIQINGATKTVTLT